ncbi:hypothetical protein Chor_009610 [Crotalus horridus]
MWLCLVFIIIITISLLRGSTGQSLKQTSGILTVTEEQPVSLNCSYEGEFRRSAGQSVKQTTGTVTVIERESVFLSCSYEAEISSSFFTYWYIQQPGQPLKLLLTEYENDAQGFHATHDEGKKNGTFNLEKKATQLEDSAIYFCAFRETQ